MSTNFPDTLPITDRPTTTEVAALLRDLPRLDAPDAEVEAWAARRDAILAEIAGAR